MEIFCIGKISLKKDYNSYLIIITEVNLSKREYF